MTQLIFDGHNDVLSVLAKNGGVADFGTGLPGQVDLPKARAGGFGGGFFALWARTEMVAGGKEPGPEVTSYDLPMPPELSQPEAWASIAKQLDVFEELCGHGYLAHCTQQADIDAARQRGQLAAILHLEGAEPIGPDLAELDVLYARGLRSLGPLWSRPNQFGHGVPFRFPSEGEIGPGLTEAGRDLVVRCGELRILIDLSHLNPAGVRDVAEISGAPLVATHSNAHAVSPHARNLTDAQLALIARSGGIAGLNFERSFVRPDGRMVDDLPTDMVLAHLDHMLNHLGEEGVAIGSDYDGCDPPKWLNSADKLPALVQAMEAHGYDAARIERICWNNWMRVLRETWGG